MLDYNTILEKACGENRTLHTILYTHSRSVADRALAVCDRHPELRLDRAFVEEAAMLHDIGIVDCDAPGIFCFGPEPYIRHGVMGAARLRALGLERHARVCERHTGAGLQRDEIQRQILPLPHRDFLPETLEEQLICYADKFYSKTRLDQAKTPERILKSLAKYGADGVERFRAWHELFN